MPDWLTSTHVTVVAGKGGVGSSTVAAAFALAAARHGADTLFIAVDGRPGMGALLGGGELDGKDQVLQRIKGAGQVRGRTIPPDQAFGDYLELRGVGGLLRRAASSASLGMIAAATPGLEHLLVLGKIKELERDRAADVIVVDAPPAGHAAPFLRSASALSDVVTSGPVRDQAGEVSEMLADPQRCQTLIVTLPEETPVTEAIELDRDLDDLGITRLAVIANSCWPDRPGLTKSPAAAARSSRVKLSAATKAALASSARFGRSRLDQQAEQLARIEQYFGAPIVLPRLPTTRLDGDDLAVLAEVLASVDVDTDLLTDADAGAAGATR
jgi:anion-transporting  ArsA/GET3 family ATPase